MKYGLRLIALFVCLLVAGGDMQAAYAQAASCNQLVTNLRALERNGTFSSLQNNVQDARRLGDSLRDMESRFVRGGCQTQLNQNQRLDRECRGLASNILRGRENYNQLAAQIETGQAIAQQREQALQQIARFGCDTGSSARFNDQTRNPQRSRNPFAEMLDRIFGGEGRIVDDGFGNYLNMSTLRTVCVRSCDGYYWPVSFSTVEQYLGQDEAICQQQCPGADVQLYYYHNPGEDPEQMVSLYGQRYVDTPTAFQYRQSYNAGCTCKQAVNYGSVQLTANGDSGATRATIAFGDLSFPLPIRDPRRGTTATVAEVIHVPLPRPRPAKPGEKTETLSPAKLASAESRGKRLVQSGDRTVRLVGPDTPYGRSEAGAL